MCNKNPRRKQEKECTDEIISKTQETNDKINKLNFININFCVSKDTVNRVTRQHTEWEKIFANHISDKRLISRT